MASNEMTFPIDISKASAVKGQKLRVFKLFCINIEFGDVFRDRNDNKQWIVLTGPTATDEQYQKAKDYILSIVRPEVTITRDTKNKILTKNMRDAIEKVSAAFMEELDGSVTINGNDMSVAIAQSLLEQKMAENEKGQPSTSGVSTNEGRVGAIANGQNRPASHHFSDEHMQAESIQKSNFDQPRVNPIFTRGALKNLNPASNYSFHCQDVSSNNFTPSPSGCASNTSNNESHNRIDPPPPDPGMLRGQERQAHQSHSPPRGPTRSSESNPPQDKQSSPIVINDRCLSQLSYLRNMGISLGFTVIEIEEALYQFDMNNIVKPAEFQTALKHIRQINQGLNTASQCPPSIPPVTASTNKSNGATSSSFIPHSIPPPSHPHSTNKKSDNSVNCRQSNSVIIISDDDDDDDDSETEKMEIYDGQSEEKDSNTKSMDEGRYALSKLSMAAPLQPTSTKASAHNPYLRYVVIDGSNVAMSHGDQKVYSVRGIQICLRYFLSKGHRAVAFVPQSRLYSSNRVPIRNKDLLESLNKSGLLKFTPARRIDGRVIASYDDRFILNLADSEQGIIVSNDLYRDLLHEKPNYKEIIETRLIQYVFVEDLFMLPDDPLGRNGPTLEEFLRMPRCNEPSRARPLTDRLRDSSQNRQRQGPNVPSKDREMPQSIQPPLKPATVISVRTKLQTDSLCNQLLSLFPEEDQKPLVLRILRNHPTETDVSRLSNFCLNAIFG